MSNSPIAIVAFEPTQAAITTGQIKETGAGGGLISGNGTFYSIPSDIDGHVDIGEIFKFTGTIAGSLTAEIDNSRGNGNDRAGTADWTTYDKLTGSGFTSGVATLVAGSVSGGTNPQPVELKRMVFGRFRFKLVVTSGTGTVRSRRILKRAY